MTRTIDVVELGPDLDAMTYGSVRELLDADVLVLQSARPGVCAQLASRRDGETVDLDDLFESAPDFDALYRDGAERILSYAGKVVFGCVGEPEANGFVLRLKEACDVRLRGGFDPAREALRLSDAGVPYAVRDARSLRGPDLDSSAALVVVGVDDAFTAGEAKIALLELWPPETEVSVLRDGSFSRTPLRELDRGQEWGSGATLVLPPLKLPEKDRYGFSDLLEIMTRLRAPGGCPWDAEQTHETLRPYLIEESYEVAEAVDSGDSQSLCDELGDVLLQVVFHAQIGRETGEFDIVDVTSAVCEKMIRRHPHVFGDARVSGSGDVLRNWDSIKRSEKNEKTWTESMRDIPVGMSSLLRAVKIQKKAANLGFEWPASAGALEKVREETAEFEAEIPGGGRKLESEGGDLLFAAVNALRMEGVDPETALMGACAKFVRRFGYIEEHADRDLRDMTLEEMDALWNEAKERERGSERKCAPAV